VPTPTPLRCRQTRCCQPLWTGPHCDAIDRKVLQDVAAHSGAPQRRHIDCDAVQVTRRTCLHVTAVRSDAGMYYAQCCCARYRCPTQYSVPSYSAIGSAVLVSVAPHPPAVQPLAGKSSKKKRDTPQYVACDRSAMPNYYLLRNASDALHRMYSTASAESGARTDSRGSGESAALAARPGSGGSTATAARTSSGGSAATATRHRS
jgi:hypothetical protein